MLRSLLILLMLALPLPAAQAETVRFPGGDTPYDKRWDFVIALLELALAKTPEGNATGDRVERLPSQAQGRRVAELKAGNLDVAVAIGSRQLQQKPVLFIPVPLERGLLGWRLLLVNRESAARMKTVRTKAALQPFALGFVRTFADWPIMEANGLNLVPANDYKTLFSMLSARRMDYLSRGVGEIYAEYALQIDEGNTHVRIEPHLALHYRADWFFIVNPAKPQLARRIEQGLRLAIQDGSYDRLFAAHFGKLLTWARLDQRTVIELDNPDAPDLGTALPADWWWQPKAKHRVPPATP